MTDDIFEQPEDAEAVTLSPDSLVDAWGDSRFHDVDDPDQENWTGAGPGVSVGSALSTVLTHGVANADWRSGPPMPDAHIEDANPIPGWSLVVVQGGSITADWVDNANSKSGKAIRWTYRDPAASDQAYLQQVYEVSPYDDWMHFRVVVDAPSGTFGAVSAFVAVQFLDKDGVATGAETRITDTPAGAKHIGFSSSVFDGLGLATIPIDAKYVALRQGMVSAGASGSRYIDALEVFARKPEVTYATYSCVEINLTGTGTDALYPSASNVIGTPIAGALRYVPPLPGYIVAVSARLSTPRTAGTYAVRGYNDSTSTAYGPTATINGTDTQNDSGYAPIGTDQQPHFDAGIDILRATGTGTGFTPTTADILVNVTVAMFDVES